MYYIKTMEDHLLDDTKEFLNGITSLKNVSDNILSNATLAMKSDTNEIYGVVSYEVFNTYGLIRYFIFKNNLDEKVIYDMFENLKHVASKNEIDSFITVVSEGNIKDLFSYLGFKLIDSNRVFIENEKNMNKKYKNAEFMVKDISTFS